MYPADYVDDLLMKTLQYCQDDDDKPPLPTAPPPLASAYTYTQIRITYHCFHITKNNYLTNIKYYNIKHTNMWLWRTRRVLMTHVVL